MVDRRSALAGHYQTGLYGKVGSPQVTLTEITGLSLLQMAAWPDTLNEVENLLTSVAGNVDAPAPGCVSVGTHCTLLRVEPLKWWIFGACAETLDSLESSKDGVALDLSHSRTHLRIRGGSSHLLLNRHLPIDLRPDQCRANTVCSTAFHHVGVTLWRSSEAWDLFLPRAFALSLFELLCETAEQFGYELR